MVGRDDRAVRAVGPVGRPARPGEGGDNDPRSCLGSLSVVSAKTPTNRPSTLCVRLELNLATCSPNQEGERPKNLTPHTNT